MPIVSGSWSRKLFKHNQDSLCRRNNLFPVKANWILTSKTRRKTHQKRTYRNQRFLLHKNTWHFIVESYRVFMKINLYIKTISLRGHFLDFRSRCYIYFFVSLSWAGVTFVETIVFIWYWSSSLSVVNRSRVGWKGSLFACK